ncbi:MAG: cupin domain-containing protein [Pseudomonadota bacterium]
MLRQADFDQALPGMTTLSAWSADPRWSGMAAMPSHAALAVAAGARTDLFIIRGALAGHPAGTFLSIGAAAHARLLNAGSEGALVFMYRDRLATAGGAVVGPQQRQWRTGAGPGLRVAPLLALDHQVMLVHWQGGTRVGLHGHAAGEEILVLSGQLNDGRASYPAGSWLRLYPGASHAPFVDEDTLILLRNGHLRRN